MKYSADNTSGAMRAFKLKKYAKYIYPNDAVSGVDLISQHSMYGKIDRGGDACSLVPGSTSIHFFESNPTVFAVDFVVRAFEDFQKHYRDTIRDGDKPYMRKTEINPVYGWVDFDGMYRASLADMRDFMVSYYLPKHQRKILNFDDFIEVFCGYFINEGVNFPITKTGNMLSTKTPVNVTGLIIEIDDKDVSDDANKMQMTENAREYKLYTTKLANYGFFVDENAPWRIVANLSSPHMQSYMVRSGVRWRPGSASNYFEQFCLKTHLEDMDELRSFFTVTYNMFVSTYPQRKATKRCSGKTKTDLAARALFNPVNPSYNEEYWLRLLLRIRLMETRTTRDFTEEDFSNTIKKAMLGVAHYNIEKGINVINTTIKEINGTLISSGVMNFSLDKEKAVGVSSMSNKSPMQAFND